MKVVELIRQLVVAAEQCDEVDLSDVEFDIHLLGKEQRYGRIADIGFGYDDIGDEIIWIWVE